MKNGPAYTPFKINKKTTIDDVTKENQDYLKDGPYRVSSIFDNIWGGGTGESKKGGPGRPKGSKNKPKNTASNIPTNIISGGLDWAKSTITFPDGTMFDGIISRKK